jgi:hypothetical protein
MFLFVQGSRKNKFAMLGVEAPVRQDVETQAYLSSVAFSQRGMHRLSTGEVIFARALRSVFARLSKNGVNASLETRDCWMGIALEIQRC